MVKVQRLSEFDGIKPETPVRLVCRGPDPYSHVGKFVESYRNSNDYYVCVIRCPDDTLLRVYVKYWDVYILDRLPT